MRTKNDKFKICSVSETEILGRQSRLCGQGLNSSEVQRLESESSYAHLEHK